MSSIFPAYLSVFERGVIRALLRGHRDEPVLLEQLRACVVTDREFTGPGVYVNLALTADVARAASEGEQAVEGNPPPLLRHPDIDYDAMALLWLKDGMVDCLEMVTQGNEDWPERDDLFIIESPEWPAARPSDS